MTTLEVVNAIDGVVIEAMSASEAKKVDTAIRKTVRAIETDMDKLHNLLHEAKTGNIHAVLGFESWTAYMADAVTIRPKDKAERKELVNLLSGEGLSSRAISEITGASQTTVVKDIRNGEPKNSPSDKKVTGLDGVEQPVAKQPKPKPKPKVAEEDEPKLPKALQEKLNLAVADAENVVEDLGTLAKNLDKLWLSAAWHGQPSSDKELTGLLTSIRKAVTALPKRPAVRKGKVVK